MEYADAVRARRSVYMLGRDVDADRVVSGIRSVAGSVPSSFNSQSARLFVLLGEDHVRLWSIVESALRAKIGDERYDKGTKAKIDGFAAAAGTILFYEVDARTEELIEKYPSYAEQFPVWAEHGNAMMQFAVWSAIADMGYGANIQHYNPLIDARVAEAFGIPEGHRLVAQMVFGSVVSPAGPKDKLSGEEIVSVVHGKM